MGIGLRSPRVISAALPFDALSLLILADSLAEALGGRTIWIVIPDVTARDLACTADVERAARRVEVLLDVLRERFGRDHFTILRTSTIRRSGWFDLIEKRCSAAVRQLLDRAPADVAQYSRQQLAHMAFMEERIGCSYKVGWAMDRDGCRDESFFDGLYKEHSDGLESVYGRAGWTTAQGRPRACPYVTDDVRTRIILERDDQVAEKVRAFEERGSSEANAALHHYEDVVAAFEARFHAVQGASLAEKIKSIITLLN